MRGGGGGRGGRVGREGGDREREREEEGWQGGMEAWGWRRGGGRVGRQGGARRESDGESGYGRREGRGMSTSKENLLVSKSNFNFYIVEVIGIRAGTAAS